MSYGECEKKDGHDDKLESGERMTLAGGTPAFLCARHLREWHTLVTATADFRKITSLRVRFAVAMDAGNEERAVTLQVDIDAAATALDKIALAWLAKEPACDICGELHPEGDDGCVDGEQDL